MAETRVDDVRHPLVELTAVRFRLMIREPEMVFWVFVFPLLMALALGVAFRSSATVAVPVVVEDGEGAAEMRAILGAAPEVTVRLLDRVETALALRDGGAHLVVVPGRPPTYRFDPTRPESRLARLVVDAVLQRAAGRVDVLESRVEEIVRPGSRYIDWLVPGLLGMNIMGTSMWGLGFSVVVARSRKLLKRMVATPMHRGHFLASLVIARLAFLGLEVLTLLGFAWLIFDIPLEGSLLSVAAVAALGAIAFGGLGLLTASRAKTVEGVSGIMNVVMMPMWVASGVFFASSNFPEIAQPFIQALPLTALVDALRGVMLNGDTMFALAPELGLLGAWGLGTFGVALRVFRWQ